MEMERQTIEGVECVVCGVQGVRVVMYGTAHVSKRSKEEAERLVEAVKPAIIFVELCKERSFLLDHDPDKPLQRSQPSMPMSEMLARVRQGRMDVVLQYAISSLYSKFTSDLKLESFPGAEFSAAARAARKFGGRVCLGDRPVSITLKRTWASLTFMEKVKFFWAGLQSLFLTVDDEMVESLLTGVDALMEEFQQVLPNASHTLVHERNLFMATGLHNLAVQLGMQWQRMASDRRSSMPGPTIVVVVGKGHLLAMAEAIGQPLSDAEFLELQNPKPARRSTATSFLPLLTALATGGAAVAAAVWWYRRRA